MQPSSARASVGTRASAARVRWIAFGAATAIAGGIADAWGLLVEILR